jgi:hypothetical protein
MTWQILIWNIFVWSLTGLLIYVTNSSLWWLLVPALLTGTNDAAELIRATKDAEEKEKFEYEYTLDDNGKKQLSSLIDKAKRGRL